VSAVPAVRRRSPEQARRNGAYQLLRRQFTQTQAELLEEKRRSDRLQASLRELDASKTQLDGELQNLAEKDLRQQQTSILSKASLSKRGPG